MCTTFGGVVGKPTVSLLACALAAPGSASGGGGKHGQCRISSAHIILPDSIFRLPEVPPRQSGRQRFYPLKPEILPDHTRKNNEQGLHNPAAVVAFRRRNGL